MRRPRAVDFHAARDLLEVFAELVVVLLELPERRLCCGVVLYDHRHDKIPFRGRESETISFSSYISTVFGKT